jgi:hypothetical protein
VDAIYRSSAVAMIIRTMSAGTTIGGTIHSLRFDMDELLQDKRTAHGLSGSPASERRALTQRYLIASGLPL